MSERVVWIEPELRRGSIKWPKCEAMNGTLAAPTNCELSAKINYSGARLCIRHAKIRALAQVLAATAILETTIPEDDATPVLPELRNL